MLNKVSKINLFILLSVLISSCSSKKNILYLQDINDSLLENQTYVDHVIQVDDILKINVMTEDVELLTLFAGDLQGTNNISNKESVIFNGYQVKTDGTINFPVVGEISAIGNTLKQFTTKLKKLLIDKGILINPIIDIKIVNSHFTILGEVNQPGRFEFLKNNINILEAISMAGDLTINGVRNDIKILRNYNGSNKVGSIDLTKSNFIETEFFQVMTGDIIIVNQNYNRTKNAGIIGNSGTLLSLLSFILSSIIVINN